MITGKHLMTTAEVADLFRVNTRTVSAWAREGRLVSVRTPGGDHRFPEETVLRFLSPRAEEAQ
ncbi:helix-turn-helix domain-containing protein [Nocardiopsis sp. CNT-189]|uniref:helix-turn-helix domain-containing protein n=1 Tax=Nocardiopsis oceanisediminis TaxID=2816862 RepID=UPI003B306CD1